MEKVLETLKEDYVLRASLKRKHLKVQDELENEIKDLEQSLITSKIIPEFCDYAKTLLKDLEREINFTVKKDANGNIEIYDEHVQMSDTIEPDKCEEGTPIEETLDYPILTIPVEYHKRKYLLGNSDKFLDSLYILKIKKNDIRKPLNISDAVSSACCVAKRGKKYGIFVYTHYGSYDSTPEICSGANPFLYTDVRICCENIWGDCGVVAVCMNGKWGVVEVSFDYYLQLIVPIQYRIWEDAAIAVEQLIGRHLSAEWFTFEKYIGESGDPSNNPQAVFKQEINHNAAILLNQNNKDIANGKDLRITFDDGTVYEGNNSKNTFINALKKIGLNKIPPVGIICSGYNLVDTRKRTDKGRIWQERVDDFYVYIYFSNPTKVDYLLRIENYYHMNMKIEAVSR